ncbi:MAG: hypothetical protein AAFN93_25990, partial [Bacteroidota bacterium]
GMENLTLGAAFALGIFISYFKPIKDSKDDEDEFWEKLGKGFVQLIAKAGLFLLFGWIASMYV